MPTRDLACLLFILAILFGSGSAVKSQEPRAAADPAEAAEIDEIKKSAAAFESAFNASDAKRIAAQFTENAEAVDEDGAILNGRDQIEARFAAMFQEHPSARIQVEVTSVRRLGPGVAVEDGYSTTTLEPNESGSRSAYTVIHLRREGKWLMASVRDFPEEVAVGTAHEQLRSLEWLVGEWVDESREGRVETVCRWADGGNYLIQEYVIKTRRGELQGTQRIGWDGVRQTIRSWAFDRNGAFTEATWTPVETGWLLKVEGVTPDGAGASATRLVTPLDKDSYRIDSNDLVIDNEQLPETSVKVVRKPPKPAM
jgi:uncharacterized protein (TIGR02246 family)